MYYYISGKLAHCTADTAVIDCGGVGYGIAISMNTYKQIRDKESCKLFTYLNVKEDALDLFGFADEQEKQFFILLLSVSGVGPKVAMALLSEMTPEELAAAVISSDTRRIQKTSGVGAKMAQRICLELKDKISKMSVAASDIPLVAEEDSSAEIADEAVSVLVALGYTKADASAAIKKCSADNTNDLVRQALRLLSRNLKGM